MINDSTFLSYSGFKTHFQIKPNILSFLRPSYIIHKAGKKNCEWWADPLVKTMSAFTKNFYRSKSLKQPFKSWWWIDEMNLFQRIFYSAYSNALYMNHFHYIWVRSNISKLMDSWAVTKIYLLIGRRCIWNIFSVLILLNSWCFNLNSLA